MKISLLPLLLLLSSCSYLSYELEYSKQRNEAKKSDDYSHWPQAKAEVEKKCSKVSGIYQGHSRVVSVYFEGGTTLTTISPEIDQILDVILSCRGSYEGVEILME
ncbi:hypothetical protein [Cellvibrio sp. NN19]|uniref:hypothetical protein n=1 Tax=Cellvibrio chitinivorans TaxID=3102792 RepID=UPI002B40B93F|nr:hypothetical protein [Cellvibrio sp. NN19]